MKILSVSQECVHVRVRRGRAWGGVGSVWPPALVMALLMSLAGCGGGDASAPPVADDPGDPPVATTLAFAGLAALGDYVAKGLAGDQAPLEPGPETDSGVGPAVPGGLSEVNVQEAGVQEADLVRSDGRVVFALRRADGAAPGPGFEAGTVPPTGEVRIFELGQPATKLTEVARFTPEGEPDAAITGQYLSDDGQRLVLVGGLADAYSSWFDLALWQSAPTNVWVVDVGTPEAPSQTRHLRLDGGLVASRVVGDTLYLVTRYHPPLPAETPPDGTLSLEAVRDLLPKVRVDGGPAEPLVQDGCYIETVAEPRSVALVSLIAVDLSDPGHPWRQVCYMGEAGTVYSSARALYVAASDFRAPAEALVDPLVEPYSVRTLVHKFAFDGLAIDYAGTGVVPGSLADTPKAAAFRFSESGADLRVVTETAQPLAFMEPVGAGGASAAEPSSPVVLTILRDPGPGLDLEVVASLPNVQRPQTIGLDGERLYASRFSGDTLYVVTFRTIDPLYVIDLADPFDPRILGELKIEGFSDYLHPVGDALLLGIGKDAEPDPAGEFRGAWVQGLQVALFDVTDPRNPVTLAREIIGERGTEAAVLLDHLGFAGLRAAERYRVAFGVNLHAGRPAQSEPWVGAPFVHAGLYRFEVDPVARTFERLPPLVIATEDSFERHAQLPFDRALLVARDEAGGDAVHYFADGKVWSQDWAGTTPVAGPQ